MKTIWPLFHEVPKPGAAHTITKERYVATFEHVFQDEQNSVIWFQQDSTPAHTSLIAMEWLWSRFQNKIISGRSEFPQPARSPDLSPHDFFLWGPKKDVMFRARSTNTEDLKIKLRAAIIASPVETLSRVVSSFDHRLSLSNASSARIIENNVSISVK